ncbi:MAG: ABC transporter ATP-binding protein [Defluviitaleaceae bacterium]|nr:ABC transporter ATP-binding protein [Defluviitaleaceae bacterium]MCL2836955.1 ABC transporter ATP-binding protein [Defluviitaleaceae bacterium]
MLISLRDVSAGYGSKTVVDCISFDIAPGEFCALLGLNGSGKTTLLKAVCGLLPVTKGMCLVNGADVSRLNERKRARHISYIPQRFSAMQGVAVTDVVMMGLNARLGAMEFPSAELKTLAFNAMETMGIGSLAGEDFSKLSEGQRQMAVLARTLVQDAPVMLMDEPDSALDFLNRHGIMAWFRRNIHAEGKAGLVTLHDPNLALAYCDRLILLRNGKIVSDMRLYRAGKDEIRECLSAVYGEITLIEHCGRYIVLLN